jgi:hypothetical protein
MSASIGDCSLASNAINMEFILSYIYLHITYICMCLRTVMAPPFTNIPNIFSSFICFISVHRRMLLTHTIIINQQTHIFQYIQPHIITFHQHVAVTSAWVSCNKNTNNIAGCWYKSLARPTSRCILFDGDISFDASLVIYKNSTNIPPIMIINRIYETHNLLSL